MSKKLGEGIWSFSLQTAGTTFWEHTTPVFHLIPLTFWHTGIPDMIPMPSDIPDIFPMKGGEFNLIKYTQM